MGSAAATAKRSGWGMSAAIWTSATKKKQNTQSKCGCQTIKRLHNKHEGSQRKLQTRAYMILQYLQPPQTYMLNIVKTVACQKDRRIPPASWPKA